MTTAFGPRWAVILGLSIFRRLRFRAYDLRERFRRLVDRQNLMNYEGKLFSQNGEDGILSEIFRRIGTTNRFAVEIGVNYQTGSLQCNTRALVEREGWTAVWIDGNEATIRQAKVDFATLPVKPVARFLTRDNIAKTFVEAGVPSEPDLLTIDVDGNDYWLWNAVSGVRSRVVVVEYNAAMGPAKDWVMPYDEQHQWDGSDRFGASLKALERSGVNLGYSLVGCDSQGVNAFFVRKDLLGSSFSKAEAGSAYHYVVGKYNHPHLGW